MLGFILWLLIMFVIMLIPFAMRKTGKRFNGRDLFFVFIGAVIMGSYCVFLNN